ncbi:hypothetical protein EMIHUDRAFT_442396 [Emiliania huxleyi CCMP1516]|uniref:Phytanoyl-CoA dioxygenase n=4 Tax=Emiliania huxleyi TaxID=2903 RepID=A0A0D3K4J9_EMIH1|nr:hypothetical protein EMIHUDRAFT_442396 [Emiliania huxleyi CCMP1516]EOD30684.1 hypothetical protein EMIHUDRAFT_442396 [Emiliania huxleyi CCMP1516]|eukprot:XP_005783113.1 hypothetical protein EMIHUDRAFT_442396 [Emiliania huxleyi CCMP1516]
MAWRHSPWVTARALGLGATAAVVVVSAVRLLRRRPPPRPAAAALPSDIARVATTAEVAAAVRAEGVCVVERVLDAAAVAALRERVAALEPRKRQNRRAKRWEHVHSPEAAAFAELAQHPSIAAAAKALLGPKHYLEKCGLVVSHPGATAQRWHMDTPHLFACREHLPPHSLSVFVPLCDLRPANGPTEFHLASHIKANLVRPPSRAAACCPAGSCVLYDPRVMHRGGANESEGERALVYLTLSRVWYRDTLNP